MGAVWLKLWSQRVWAFFLIDRAAIYMTVTNNYAVVVVMVIRCPARV